MLAHFVQRRRYTHKQTWFQHIHQPDGSYKTRRSRTDYITGTDRRLFQSVRITQLSQFSSDHYAIVAKFLTKPSKCHYRYLRGRKQFPLTASKWGPLTQADSLFQDVCHQCPPPPRHNPVK